MISISIRPVESEKLTLRSPSAVGLLDRTGDGNPVIHDWGQILLDAAIRPGEPAPGRRTLPAIDRIVPGDNRLWIGESPKLTPQFRQRAARCPGRDKAVDESWPIRNHAAAGA